ncbi:MAG: OmpA family protein [Terrimicrobiaceae bacterium]
MRKFPLHLALVVGLGLSLSACNKKKSDLYAGVDGDFVSGTPLGERVEGANFFGTNVTRGKFAPLYFIYDSYEVSGAEKPKIEQVATAMKSSPGNLIVAGFTDDRGTEEYNRGLGERRAQAVRQALIDAGVPAAKIQTVSFGKEMPADSGSGESAWALNRRAEFGVVK